MSALSDFVNEQRNKSGSSNGGIRPSFSSLTNMGMRPSFSMANIGTKIGTSFNGFFKTDGSDDLEALTDNPAQNGQLPSTRNRRPGATTGWFSFGADEAVCGLTRFQRISAFFLFMFAAAFCLHLFGFLWGPLAYVQFLFSIQRRLVTGVYLTTVLATLYTSLWWQNTILTIICSSLQTAALIWYLLSFIPGGETGLKFITKMFTKMLCSSQSSKLVLPI